MQATARAGTLQRTDTLSCAPENDVQKIVLQRTESVCWILQEYEIAAEQLAQVVSVSYCRCVVFTRRGEIPQTQDLVVCACWTTVEVSTQQNRARGRHRAMLGTQVKLQKAQNFAKLPHANDAEVGLMREDQVRIDDQKLRTLITAHIWAHRHAKHHRNPVP